MGSRRRLGIVVCVMMGRRRLERLGVLRRFVRGLRWGNWRGGNFRGGGGSRRVGRSLRSFGGRGILRRGKLLNGMGGRWGRCVRILRICCGRRRFCWGLWRFILGIGGWKLFEGGFGKRRWMRGVAALSRRGWGGDCRIARRWRWAFVVVEILDEFCALKSAGGDTGGTKSWFEFLSHGNAHPCGVAAKRRGESILSGPVPGRGL